MTLAPVIGSDGVARYGIGGSDIAAILGLSKWRTPLDASLRILGRAEPDAGSDAAEIGVELEPWLRRYYVAQTGYSIQVFDAPLYHPDHGWARAHPDGVAVDPEDPEGTWLHGWEAKTEGLMRPPGVELSGFGEEYTDEVPEEYGCQALWYLWITGLERWDFTAAIAGRGRASFRVWRDDDVIDWMVHEAHRFWHEHVIADVQPPVDGSESFRRYFTRRFAKTNGEILVADEDDESLIVEFVEAHNDMKEAEERKALAHNRLMERIGEARALQSALGKVTMVRKRGNPSWKQIAERIAAEHDIPRREIDALAEECRGQESAYVLPPRKKVTP